MASPPSIKKLSETDFPDQKAWIGKLLQPLNTFMTEVADGLSRALTFAQNFAGEIRELQVSMPISGSVQFTPNQSRRPIGLKVIQVVEQGKTAPTLTGPVSVDGWYWNNNMITIPTIYGLDTTAGRIFRLTLLVIGG